MITPWFGGDRLFEQQMMGLDWLAEACHGKSILDFGCAEGLISIHLLKNGAKSAFGVELVPERVERARRLAKGLPFYVVQGDAEVWAPLGPYDITLALAILHKLKDPSTVARRLAQHTKEMIVLRLPPAGAVIVDRRSGMVPHDMTAVLGEFGFVLTRATNDGPFGEFIAAYKKV